MSILVTGGAGYVGSHTVRALQTRGEDVVVLDNLSTGHRAAVLGSELVQGDIGDRHVLDHLFDRHSISAVVHIAGPKSVEESMRDPARYFRENVCGTLTLADAALAAGIRHLIFSSSAAIYGSASAPPVTEETPPAPMNPYGESKLMAERVLHWLDAGRGLRYVALRYFNAAGASPDGSLGEDWTAAANLLPRIMRATLGRSGPVQVYGTDYDTPDGTAIRDYVHVTDLAEAHLAALDHLRAGRPSVTLNLGTGRGSSVLEVVRATHEASGREVPVEMGPRRPGDPPAIWADASRAEQILGWRTRLGLDEIVRSAWRWHSEHPDGVASAEPARPSLVGDAE